MRIQPVQHFTPTQIDQILLDDDFDALDADAFESDALHAGHADVEDSWSDEALLEGI